MLERLLEESLAHAERETDVLVYAHEAYFDAYGSIVVPDALFNGSAMYRMTEWSLQKACDKLGPPSKRYIERCPGWLQAENLNYWREQLPENRQWLVRTYDGDCRAVLSKEYSVLHNHEMLQWAIEYGAGAGTTVQPYLSPDTMHLKIRMAGRDIGRDLGDFGFGVYLGNGEIGNRSIRVLPFVQRTSCTNSIIFSDGWTTPHRFKTRPMIEAKVKHHIAKGLRVATEKIDAIWQAAIDELPNLGDIVAQLCKEKGLAEETQRDILIGTEGRETRMGLANGLSWAAHHQDNPELTIDMETWAGAVIAEPNSLFGMVARLQEAVLEE